jgi:hypothetical protein
MKNFVLGTGPQAPKLASGRRIEAPAILLGCGLLAAPSSGMAGGAFVEGAR